MRYRVLHGSIKTDSGYVSEGGEFDAQPSDVAGLPEGVVAQVAPPAPPTPTVAAKSAKKASP